MTLLKFKHANLGTTVYVPENLIFAHYYSPGHKSTMLVASGGGMVPITESAEEVTQRLEEIRQPKSRSKSNGTTKA